MRTGYVSRASSTANSRPTSGADLPGPLVRRLREACKLTPGATLEPFEAVRRGPGPIVAPHTAGPAALPAPHAAALALRNAPSARDALPLTHRCASGHGRFTPFVQFLREKDFIRPLTRPSGRASSRSSVRSAAPPAAAPVDLEKDSACPYCRAPISILDPDAIGATVRALESAETQRKQIDVDGLVDGMLEAHRRSVEFDRVEARRDGAGSAAVDLIALGLGAVAALLAR